MIDLKPYLEKLPELYAKHGWTPKRGCSDGPNKRCCALHIIGIELFGRIDPKNFDGPEVSDYYSFAFGFDDAVPLSHGHNQMMYDLGKAAYRQLVTSGMKVAPDE